MSSARGAAGAVKSKLHNVNSVYAGKNQNAVKAPGAGKHGGLQSLGKTAAVVRRMPPPATLPSLRAESQGQDPNIALVPQGGSGWAKGDTNSANANTTESQPGANSSAAANSLGAIAAANSGNSGTNSSAIHSTDLRPKWAKQSSTSNAQSSVQTSTSAASSRDFPSLAAATANTTGKSNAAMNESLKPQKSGSWRAGGSSSGSKNEANEAMAAMPQHTGANTAYMTASSLTRTIERQLPSRYYDTTSVPPPPPSGTFQVPKLQVNSTVAKTAQEETNDAYTFSIENVSDQAESTATTAITQSTANVTIPPPNYSQPPPNFVSSEPMRTSAEYIASSLAPEDVQSYRNERPGQQKVGHGDEGYKDRKYRQLIGDSRSGTHDGSQLSGTNDVRGLIGTRKDMYENREIGFDEYSMDWSRNTYGYSENETDARRWRHSGGSGSETQRYVTEFPQNGYNRNRDEELGRRQSIEREAAIERSRQKRRIASQSSALSESETGSNSPNVYGSVRMMHAYENDLCQELEQTARDSTDESAKQSQHQRWNAVSSAYDDKEVAPKPEYRMLRRPESKESGEIVQHFSQVMLNDEHDEDEEEFQLTKLSRPSAKIIKRVAPSVAVPQLDDNSGQTTQVQSKNRQYPRDNNSTNANEWAGQNQKMMSRTQSQTLQQDGNVAQTFQSGLPVVLPADNVWEKRAEERESAERERERERAAQREALHQMRLQQHFPAVGEQPAAVMGSMELESCADMLGGSGRVKDYSRNSEQPPRKQNNRNRTRDGQKWAERKYSGTAELKEDGDEAQGTNGVPFRGQREFVNSRVHRSGRGSSLMGTRGGRVHTRVANPNARRGGSVPQQQQQQGGVRAQHRYGERGAPKHSGRRNEVQLTEKDNFSNMGEFHVEDTYAVAPSAEAITEEMSVGDQSMDAFSEDAQFKDQNTGGERRQRVARGSSHRSTQQLYEPRKRQEYNRSSGRRGNRGGGGAAVGDTTAAAAAGKGTEAATRSVEMRYAGSYQNAGERDQERDKRKRNIASEKREAAGDGGSGPRAPNQRSDGYRRGGGGSRGGQQRGMRRRRHSPNQANVTSAPSDDFAGPLKSPIVSEGHEEWETASESSDFVHQPTTQRRPNPPAKYSSSRRVRASNGQQRTDNAGGGAANRTANNSKNAKPASITSHAAVRAPTLTKEEVAQTTAETTRRDTCKDGLAGLDINNAGVIVIDDRPDGQLDDANENNDDFEEVLSKKSKKLRQQQINELAEAEERRKLKEKEKLERRKTRTQMKRTERRTNNALARNASGSKGAEKGAAVGNGHVFAAKTAAELGQPQNTLNTTVWNSSIVREQTVRSSPPLENRQVIPSPIARPTPKTSVSSTVNANSAGGASKKELDLWTTGGAVDDKLSDPSSLKQNSVEFSANFAGATRVDNGQYDFTFDPSLEENLQTIKANATGAQLVDGDSLVKQTESIGLASSTLQTNDDECLKQRLDKVKDFWPGQQQYNSSIIGSGGEKALVPDKVTSSGVGATSMSHGPNVAKVRPQPQASEQTAVIVGAMKEIAISSTPSIASLPPQSPIACLPPGAYLQSLSQVPPPAPFPHYSVVFGDHYNLSSSPVAAQTMFSAGVNKLTQAQNTRSRPGSFIEQSPLFIHPPPGTAAAVAAAAANNLTWSNSSPQMELLGAGISAAATLAQSQSVNAGAQCFQVSSPRSASTFGALTSMLGSNGKLTHIGPPPSHHQIPPPIAHPPHNFMAPPPDFLPLSATNLGPVGSQRNNENSAGVTLQRQIPPPPLPSAQHMQQPMSFAQPTHNGFSTGAAAFNQAPPMPHHAFSAPPPPLRYPAMSQMSSNEMANIGGNGSWPQPSMVAFKIPNSSLPSVNRAIIGRSQHNDRWTLPLNMQPQYAVPHNCQHQQPQQHRQSQQQQQQQHGGHKDNHITIQTNIELFRATPTLDDDLRASSVSSVSAPVTEALDGGATQQKATKV